MEAGGGRLNLDRGSADQRSRWICYGAANAGTILRAQRERK